MSDGAAFVLCSGGAVQGARIAAVMMSASDHSAVMI